MHTYTLMIACCSCKLTAPKMPKKPAVARKSPLSASFDWVMSVKVSRARPAASRPRADCKSGSIPGNDGGDTLDIAQHSAALSEVIFGRMHSLEWESLLKAMLHSTRYGRV